MSTVTIRRMQPADLLQVCAIEKDCFSMPWSQCSFAESMERPDTVFLSALEGEEIVGYVGCYCTCETAEITNVAVKASRRRQGIGDLLLKQLLREAAPVCEEILLEVRESNQAAISLYARQGFEKIGIRKNFYEKPIENAVIMCRKLETAVE